MAPGESAVVCHKSMMEFSGSNNRRKHPRTRLALAVSATVINASEQAALTGRKFECQTRDISFQGVCLLCDVRIAPGSILELTVSIDGQARIFTFKGIVMWCNYDAEYRVHKTGVQFQDIEEIPHDWKMTVINLLSESLNRSMAF